MADSWSLSCSVAMLSGMDWRGMDSVAGVVPCLLIDDSLLVSCCRSAALRNCGLWAVVDYSNLFGFFNCLDLVVEEAAAASILSEFD